MVLTTLLVDAARIQQHPDGNMEKELKRGNENYEDTCIIQFVHIQKLGMWFLLAVTDSQTYKTYMITLIYEFIKIFDYLNI